MTLARWPDEDWAEIAKIIDGGTKTEGPQPPAEERRGGTFQYEGDRPSRWSVERGIWLRGYWCFDWAEDVVKVKSLELEKSLITVASPHTFGMRQGNPSPRRWYALNLLEELTRPGEFFLDTEENLLYFWPPKDLDGTRLALSTMMDPGISLTRADHVTLRGLVVEEGGSGITVADSSHVRIEACTIRNQHFVGISVNGGVDTMTGAHRFGQRVPCKTISGIIIGDLDGYLRGDLQTAAGQFAVPRCGDHIHNHGVPPGPMPPPAQWCRRAGAAVQDSLRACSISSSPVKPAGYGNQS